MAMRNPLKARLWSFPILLGVDLVLLHLSMFFAVALAAAYHLATEDPSQTPLLLAELRQCYLLFSAAISPVFLLVLWANGFYSKKLLNLSVKKRFARHARAIASAALVSLAWDYLVLRNHIVARSVSLSFSVIVLAVLLGSRWMQETILQRYELVERKGNRRLSADAPILIVGGAGYIGSMLCRLLLSAGERVRVLDCLVYGDAAIEELKSNPRFELIEGDCRNIQSVVQAIRDVKSVVHLAAIVGDPACDQDKQSALEINYAATRMLAEVCKGHGIERFVFASSCSVYGASDELMDEHSPIVPLSLYGQTKVDSEAALLEASSTTFHPVILRLATVFGYGYRPRFDLFVNLLSARAVRDGVITIYNEEQWRPFIHVWDVARGFASALQAPIEQVSGEIFNLGDNHLNYKLSEVAHEISHAFPATQVKYVANDDRRSYRVNFQKIRSTLDFKCTVSLREGIEELRRALEDGLVSDYNDARYNNQKFLARAGILTSPNEIDHGIMAAFAGQPVLAPTLRRTL
jgi:nucleoside-diphosphate-sugar epimerase